MNKKEVVGFIYQTSPEGDYDKVDGYEILTEDGRCENLDNWLDHYLSFSGVKKKIRLTVEFITNDSPITSKGET